ncbi:hypothetical protein AAFN60_18215 [Roseibacillus persicicus]|uniref:hypothetical protein n=1 Tax=Roseibacillus persicicus TaxID=454148 RepID=UPI00398AB691
MAYLKLAFDGGEFCCVINYRTGLGVDYLERRQFFPDDLRGNWNWFQKQIPHNQNFSNIGVLHMLGVKREKQQQGFGRRALRLVTHLMKSEGATVGFLEADPYMNFCKDGYYEQYVAERVGFYGSEGWTQLESEQPHPPRQHMWMDFSQLITRPPTETQWEKATEDEFNAGLSASNQEGYRPGTTDD